MVLSDDRMSEVYEVIDWKKSAVKIFWYHNLKNNTYDYHVCPLTFEALTSIICSKENDKNNEECPPFS